MAQRLDASELGGGTLSLIQVAEREFEVLAGGLPVGQIIARRRSFGRIVWFWSLSGPHLPETMEGAGSNAHTLVGAKAAVKNCLDTWLQSQPGQSAELRWDRPTAVPRF